MLKQLTSIILVLFLISGCAMMTPSPSSDNKKLMRASQDTQRALEQARRINVEAMRGLELNNLQSRYESLEQKRNDSPSMELVKEYNDLTVKILEISLKTLETRLSERDQQIRKLEKRIGGKNDQINELEKKVSVLQREKENLNSAITSLKNARKQLETRVQSLKQNTDAMQNRIADFKSQISELEKKLDEKEQQVKKLKDKNQEIVADFKNRLDKAEVQEKNQRVYVTVQSKILFDVADTEIKHYAEKTLNNIAAGLKKYSDREVRVEGHTDDLRLQNEFKRKYGTNWELSAQRAINVLKYLVNEKSVEPKRIAAVAFGEHRPLVPNNSPENRAKNRRVEVVILPPKVPTKTKEVNELPSE